MKIKKIAAYTIFAAVAGGAVAAGFYHALTRDPTPIKIDPKLYDDYAAYYDFGHGYIVTIHRDSKKSVLSRFPDTKRIFTKSDGKFYATGDLFREPELAGTLRKVAAQGASCMYEGEWGQKFVEVIRRNGGKITQQDMKNYKATWEEPLHLVKGWKHGAGLLGGDSDRSVQPPDERRRVTRIGGTISGLLNPEKHAAHKR